LEPLEALSQILYLLAATGGAILSLELILYWFFYKFDKKFFIPISAVIGSTLFTFFHVFGWIQDDTTAVFTGGIGFMAFAVFNKIYFRGRHRIPLMMLAPAVLAVSLLVIYPFFFEMKLAFSNLNLYTINKWLNGGDLKFVGFRNFINVFTSSPLQTATFWELLGRTFIWTGINLVFHVGFGLGLAILLNKKISGKGFYRMLLIVPWAMPQVVAILAWRGEFHPQFGIINHLLQYFGLTGISWWSDPLPVFISCCFVNIWLGVPFMMIVFLGGLQSIPKSYYEAASIDGASKWVQFKEITVPMLKPAVVPSITLGAIWTFNNINVIYLMTGGNGGSEHADILVSALYKSAFTYTRYSFSAAFALIIFAVLLVMTVAWMKISKGTEGTV
jgi:arabinogalactan oligomer / maltooligosaccharide transport system permease protein